MRYFNGSDYKEKGILYKKIDDSKQIGLIKDEAIDDTKIYFKFKYLENKGDTITVQNQSMFSGKTSGTIIEVFNDINYNVKDTIELNGSKYSIYKIEEKHKENRITSRFKNNIKIKIISCN